MMARQPPDDGAVGKESGEATILDTGDGGRGVDPRLRAAPFWRKTLQDWPVA
jgi:hypothetical protein